ncbi:ComF family protein [Chlorobium sp. BLA1]|uniref:ComF family protein n=1 Tax=Candidatus Chlorobium masyuteum TaxID=2716876 RepID=UPI00141F60C6|nr:phosphoribosyltransferase family protein [Candidatus Chlorobium masyuteum]NHQ59410.1 ComF family protein [Candidatus Chlorobium masyuteum]
MLEELLHLLCPNVCIVCRKGLVPGEKYCCSSCMEEFDSFSTPSSSEAMLRHTIASRFGGKFPFEKGWCRYLFHKESSLQQALHAMKYEGLFNLANSFGRQLGEWMLEGCNTPDIDCIVPVPLHSLKKIERSYNQSDKIAEGIAAVLHKPVRRDLLKRKRNTRSQTGLSAAARKKNVDGAFQTLPALTVRHLLLVDDVVTTGATMAAAAAALRDGGAERISIAAVALAAKE